MEVVWQALSEDANARLDRAEAETKSNLHLTCHDRATSPGDRMRLNDARLDQV